MPERPRSHELESESRNRLEALILRHHWLIRDLDRSSDYGIDQEVEVFANGRTTGLTFRVQTKGAETPDSIGPFRDVAIEHFNYWRSLDGPVMLILWVASEDQLYGKWVHAYDFGPNPRGKKTRRVRFTDADLLEKRMPQIRSELEAMRAMGDGPLPRPLPLRLSIEPSTLEPAIVEVMRGHIAEHKLSQVLHLSTSSEHAISAIVTDRQLRVQLPVNVGSVNLHKNRLLREENVSWIVHEILVGVGVLASRLGATSDAIRLFRGAVFGSAIAEMPHAIFWIGEAAIREKAVGPAMEKLLEVFWGEGELNEEASDFYMSLLQVCAGSLTEHDIKFLDRAVRHSVEREVMAGRNKLAAHVAYNMCTILKSAERWHMAGEYLQIALSIDPDGLGRRGDIAITQGNIGWHEGDFPGAATAYEAAMELGEPKADVIPPLSDVLMELGDYARSAELIDAWFEEDGDIDPRSAARRIILAEVLEGLGVTKQDRLAAIEHPFDPEQGGSATEFLRQVDALSLEAWMSLDWSSPSESGSPIGRVALLAFRTNDARAWLLVIKLGKLGNMDAWLLEHVIEEALPSPGFLSVVTEALQQNDDPDLTDFLSDLQQKAIAFEARPEPKRINLIDENNQIVQVLTTDALAED